MTTSRGISNRIKVSRNSHTPGKDKGAFCVKRPEAHTAISANPYKGDGLKGQVKAQYNRFWGIMLPINGVKN